MKDIFILPVCLPRRYNKDEYMEAINYVVDGKNMVLTEDAQIVQGVSGNGCYLPAGVGTIALAGNRNELSVSLWRQWDGVVETDAPRGVFSFKNIQCFFDHETDLLTVVINDFKAITDIKDDQKQAHWCFIFAKNNRFTIYKDSKTVYELSAGDKPVDMTDGFTLGGGKTHATFDEVRVYKTVLKQGGINGLFYLVSKGTQIKQLESIIQGYTPKYLGVTETVPTTRTAYITKGEKLGAQDAHAGDWVLMAKTIGGWKCGVCYRWTGSMWINLEPEYNYTEQYQAALYHICEIEELMKDTGHFGALFAKVLVAQKALIDNLVVQEAFINQLAVNQAFLRQLIVQKLRIDSDDTTHQDFEAWFDQEHGLKINNKGEEMFKVDTAGNVFAKNAFLQDGTFTGEIHSGPLHLSSVQPAARTINLMATQTAKDIYLQWGTCSYSVTDKGGNKNIVRFSAISSSFTEPYYDDLFDDLVKVGERTCRMYVVNVHTSNGSSEKGDYAGYGETTSKRITRSGWWGTIPDHDFSEMNRNLTKNYNLEIVTGGKTFRLEDLPTQAPALNGCVWKDQKGFLRIS